MSPVAIVRPVSATLAGCELSFVDRAPIDLALARSQHAAYVQALRDAGCAVIVAPALDDHPDAVFVEDTAVVVDEQAVMMQPGAASRRGEVASIGDILAVHRPLAWLQGEATLDGGDVLRIGRAVYVGQGARSNAQGLAQLRAALAPHGYTVQGVRTRHCLHLKSAVTAIADDAVLIQPEWLVDDVLDGCRRIEVDPSEPHAANVLRIGEALLMPASFPKTVQRLRADGFSPGLLNLSELQKAEGATTCCSIVFAA